MDQSERSEQPLNLYTTQGVDTWTNQSDYSTGSEGPIGPVAGFMGKFPEDGETLFFIKNSVGRH